MHTIKVLTATSAVLLLAACGTTRTLSRDFGVSVQQNTAVQTLDVNAVNREAPPPTLDGVKAEAAVDRYRKDRPDESRAKLVEKQ